VEDLNDRIEELESIDDLAEERYKMFKIFEGVLDKLEADSPGDLDGMDGYLYKLSQEFLTSSSTFEKRKKLEDIAEHVNKKFS